MRVSTGDLVSVMALLALGAGAGVLLAQTDAPDESAPRALAVPDPGPEQPPPALGAHEPPRPHDYRQATGLKKLLYWLGNFHPAGTDLPVGTILAALVSELLLLATRREFFAGVTRFCVWLAGLSAVAVAFGGWCLAGFRLDDPNWMLQTHRWWGTGAALAMVGLVVMVEYAHRKHTPATRLWFRAALVAAVAVVGVTGFFGGAMIYGADHYNWPP